MTTTLTNEPVKSVDTFGTIRWRLNGKFHREDGPAFEYADGEKYWYLDGKRHREDGTAVEFADGEKEYWYKGIRYPNIKTDKKWIQYLKLMNFK